MRGDWFMATALGPPLYGDLLQPRRQPRRDRPAGVSGSTSTRTSPGSRSSALPAAGASWTLPTACSSGTTTSGGGYLWLTYHLGPGEDVRRSAARAAQPGQRIPGTASPRVATEAIWSLPNGLQAYLLADRDGNRVDAAATAIVQDPRPPERRGWRPPRLQRVPRRQPGLHRPQWPSTSQTTCSSGPRTSARPRSIRSAASTRPRRTDPGRRCGPVSADLGGLLGDRLPATDTIEWDDFVTLRGQYESKLGLRQMRPRAGRRLVHRPEAVAAQTSARRARSRWTLTEPLVPRDEWICRFRRIARQARGADLCAGTFTAIELRSFCNDR